MAEQTFDDDALNELVAYFAERVYLVFAFFYCVIIFEDEEDLEANPWENGRAWGLRTIRCACLHTTLIALRDLNDVMSPRTKNTKDDDLRLSDFGYAKHLSFLTKTERDRINKEIAHTTLPISDPSKRRWDIFELATKGIRQSLTFMEWVQHHFATTHPMASLMTMCFRTRTEKTYEYFVGALKKQRKKTGSLK